MKSFDTPTIASYCATFLRPEMWHVYRQVTGLKQHRSVVLTQKREGRERFPFQEVYTIPRSTTRFFRRLWHRQIWNRPVPLSKREAAQTYQVLQRTDAQLLHIYFGNIGVRLLPLIQQYWKGPVVVSFHGADVSVELDKPAHLRATRELFGAVDLVLARSHSLIEELSKVGCPKQKLRLQRTGIPLEKFPFHLRKWPQDGRWVLLQAGRLIEKKGFRTSLCALKSFVKQYPRAVLRIAGEGELKAELQKLIADLQLEKHVEFLGFLSQAELKRELETAHFYLQPSQMGSDGNQEGVPNALLEAMATGLIPFGTEHGGIPEAISTPDCGWLVPEKNSTALANALLETAAMPLEKLDLMSQVAANHTREHFEQEAQIAQLESYYRELISRR